MLKISSFLLSPENFPQYRYVRQYVPNLLERYDDFARSICLNENLDCPKFDFVYVHICESSSTHKLFEINEIISSRTLDSLKPIAKDNFETLATFQDNFKKDNSSDVSVVVISEDCVAQDEVISLQNRYEKTLFVLVDTDQKIAGDANPTVITSSKVNVNNDIGDLLERFVLRSIKWKCVTLDVLLDKKKLPDKPNTFIEDRMKTQANGDNRKKKHSRVYPENGKKSLRTNDEKISKVVHEECSRYPAGEFNGCINKSYQMSDTYQQSSPANGTEQDYALATCSGGNRNEERRISHLVHKELLDVDRDTAESLIAEMTALFKTSNVPEHEKPKVVCGKKAEISKELKQELFNAVPTIERIGYGFSKFVVYVGKDAEARNDKERKATKRKIQEVLSHFDIKDFTVEFISKGITNYCDVGVGAKIKSTTDTGKPAIGTLGCFANMKDHEANNICALISGHVARGRDCFYFYSETTESFQVLGNVINESVASDGLDIAALKVKSDIKICTKFRKEQDNPDNTVSQLLPGKLHQNSGDRCTDVLECGLYVYIWGALSKPGKGVVTMRSEGMDDSLIQIEDRRAKRGETSVPFCKPGDSGAIVCAEDRSGEFVHVIGMVIGEIGNRDDYTEQTVGKYVSVPLCDGLRELERRTGCSFEICGCENE